LFISKFITYVIFNIKTIEPDLTGNHVIIINQKDSRINKTVTYLLTENKYFCIKNIIQFPPKR